MRLDCTCVIAKTASSNAAIYVTVPPVFVLETGYVTIISFAPSPPLSLSSSQYTQHTQCTMAGECALSTVARLLLQQ